MCQSFLSGHCEVLKDTELSPLRLWCWLRALSEAPVTQQPLPSVLWEAAGEAFLAFPTSVGLLGVPLAQLLTVPWLLGAGAKWDLQWKAEGFFLPFCWSHEFPWSCACELCSALLCSTGIRGGGGDAARSLLLFPVLSELLSPLRCLGQACCSSDLQLFVSLPGTSQQQSGIAAPSLPPHAEGAAREGKQGMSYSDGFSRRQGRSSSYSHPHLLVSSLLIWPGFASLPCGTLNWGSFNGDY